MGHKKEYILNDEGWMMPFKRRNMFDIIISRRSVNQGLRFAILFRNGCQEKITENGCIDIQICKDRVYFRGNGHWTLSRSSQYHSTRYVFAPDKNFSDFVGYYDLQYDEKLELYYIEKKGCNNGSI